LLLIGLIELVKFFTPALCESWAFVRAHKGPLFILLDTSHEDVRNPKCIEQVASAVLFFTMILTKLQIIIDVGVPRLKIDSKGSATFSTTLVNIASCVIEDL
jgi:hypothetical protein